MKIAEFIQPSKKLFEIKEKQTVLRNKINIL